MLATLAVNGATYISLARYGMNSREYHYAYYYTDSLPLFFVIIQPTSRSRRK